MKSNENNQSKEIEKKLLEYIEQINRLETKIAEINVKYNNAQIELNQQRNIKRQLRNLYDSIDQKLITTIDKRGRVRNLKKKTRVYNIDTDNIATKSLDELILEAKKYDISTNYRYKALKNPKKLHYRLIDKSYRTTRNVFFYGAKHSYRMIKKIKGNIK